MKNYPAAGSLLIGLLALVLMNAGCVSTTLPLSSNHPARADAPSGQVESEPAAILRPDAPSNSSGTLAATSNRGDRQPALPSESSADAPEPEGTRDAPYVGQGVIERIGEAELEIQHEAIPGFMGAMRMAFQVDEEAMDDSFEVGDEIIFKIEAHPEHGYQIFSVDEVAAESDGASASETGRQDNSPGSTGSQP